MGICPSCGKPFDSEEAEMVLFQCKGCEEFTEEDDGPLYECNSCGNVYTRGATDNENHICPECHRFGAKSAEMGCPNCQADELVEVTVIRCPHCEHTEAIA